MKKLLVVLAMLSMTSLLFTACNKEGEEATEETTPAAAEESVVVPAPVVDVTVDAEAPAAEVK